MKTRPITAVEFRQNLERAMRNLSLKSSQYNLDALARDMKKAVPDPARKFPAEIIRELQANGTWASCLPAYRRTNPSGLRFPDAENINPHTPEADRHGELTQSFHFQQFADAVKRLGDWLSAQGIDPTVYRLPAAMVGLLLRYPFLSVGEQTPRMLAGQVGMSELVELLTTHYGPGTTHWDDLDDEDDLDFDDEDAEDNPRPIMFFDGGNF